MNRKPRERDDVRRLGQLGPGRIERERPRSRPSRIWRRRPTTSARGKIGWTSPEHRAR
jgi:hypothetical protein